MQAGWQGLFAIEREENAFKTLQHNLLNEDGEYCFQWPEWLPKTPHSSEDTLENYSEQLKNLRGKVDMIVGGPPCQGFSMAGRRISTDPRNKLYRSYLDFVRLVEPTIVLFENVLGIATDFKDAEGSQTTNYAEKLLEDLSESYDVSWQVLNARDFAVAQSRRRFFAIAIRRDNATKPNKLPFEMLKEILPKWIKDKGVKNLPVSVKRAISDLEVNYAGIQPSSDTKGFMEVGFNGTRTSYQQMLHKGKRGHPGNLRLARHLSKIKKRFARMIKYSERHDCKGQNIAPEFLHKIGIKKSSIRVLDEKLPAPTLTSHPDDLIHYSEPRILSVREMARLQSFPDWFEFCGKYTTGGLRRRFEVPRFTQVANAVPPMMAEVLGLVLKKYCYLEGKSLAHS